MARRQFGKLLRLVFTIVTLLPLIFAGCSGSADASKSTDARSVETTATHAEPQPVRAIARIVFLGDSLTAGLGLPREQAVPSLIQDRLRSEGFDYYEVVNAGVSGDTSAGGLSRMDWSLEGDVEILVVELGANDGLRGLPVAQLRSNLDTIIKRARERDITVVLTGMEAPPNYGLAYTSQFRQVYRDLADEYDVVFDPFFLEGVAGRPSLNNRDGIHPNAEGAKIIADRMWDVLEPLLEKHDR
ncbi:MAG: arylesterase [Acidobacteria bacterium]|nr:arylesterase [Acidobacteriota bacterium]